MTIFYVDTSSNYLYTGIYRDNKMIIEKKLNLSRDLSTYAVFEIDKMFQEASIDVLDIDKIIVVSGPGSFTGIRIGMTLAKIYALMLKKDIISITSLEAMNASYTYSGLKIPVIDARRGYCYASIYLDDKLLLEGQYISISRLKDMVLSYNQDYIYISNDKIDGLFTQKYEPDLLKIINKYKSRPSINPHLIEPTYFKLTEAEENLNRE